MAAFNRTLLIALAWAGALMALLAFGRLVFPDGDPGVGQGLAMYAGIGLWLGALPAGITLARQVFPPTEPISLPALTGFGAALILVAAVTFTLICYLAPISRGSGPAGEAARAAGEPAVMTLGTLRAEAEEAALEMEAGLAAGEVRAEWRANLLVWHYTRRIASLPQVVLFGLIGLLAGYWGQRVPARSLAHTLYWALAFFLFVSTYLAGENSFELVALPSTAPAFFAGFFVLIIPPVLVLGLAIPTCISIWNAWREAA